MSNKKYGYSYEIVTKDGEKITNRMKNGFELNAEKQSTATKILKLKYPGCKIIHLKTKTPVMFARFNDSFIY